MSPCEPGIAVANLTAREAFQQTRLRSTKVYLVPRADNKRRRTHANNNTRIEAARFVPLTRATLSRIQRNWKINNDEGLDRSKKENYVQVKLA